MFLMVGGKGGDGGEAADRGEGAYAELHHERYGREKMVSACIMVSAYII